MKQCPNCAKYFEAGSKCPYCKVDTVLYEGIIRMSDKLYNQGLEKLENAEFSQGIKFLNKSVVMNKDNWVARNLLGLALFEIGHVGDALTHWVISDAKPDKDNPAKDYLALAEKNTRYMEKLNDAVIMYNTALLHIRKKNEDLAIVQLKKAVEDNPNFVDALNLLALCYLIQNDKNRASDAVRRVLAKDITNPTALKYNALLNPGKQNIPRPAVMQPQKTTNVIKPGLYGVGLQEKKSISPHITGILTLIIGAACTVAVMYFLVIPSMHREHEAEMSRMEEQIIQMQDSHALEIEAFNDENEGLQTSLSSARADNLVFSQALLLQERINTVHQAYWLYQNEQYRDAYNLLIDFDGEGLPFDIRGRIDYILENLAVPLGNIYFAEGQRAFDDGDFVQALEHLEFAFSFMTQATSTNNQWREILFMLGSLYYQNENFDSAYEKLVELNRIAPGHRPNATGNMLRSIREQ